MENFLVPYLSIGGTREAFWGLTPKTIQYDFKAFQKQQQRKTEHEIQIAWLNGFYMKQALQTTILVAGLADKNSAHKMPKYPEMPQPQTEKKKEPNKEFRTEFWVAKMDKLMRHINNSNQTKRGIKPNE